MPTDPNPTREAVTADAVREIVAREIFALWRSEGSWSGSRAQARETWYRRTPAATMDDWRRRAETLIESLGASNITLNLDPEVAERAGLVPDRRSRAGTASHCCHRHMIQRRTGQPVTGDCDTTGNVAADETPAQLGQIWEWRGTERPRQRYQVESTESDAVTLIPCDPNDRRPFVKVGHRTLAAEYDLVAAEPGGRAT
jgi:hypothetical protein